MSNPRSVALNILLKIEEEKAYSNLALTNAIRENRLGGVDASFVSALVYGVVMNRLLHSERGRTVRIVLAALIALDLIVRLIPLGFTQAFGLPCEIAAFVLRAVSLVLVLLDLRTGRSANA